MIAFLLAPLLAVSPVRADDQTQERRAPPAPIDPIFPSSEFLGPTIGVPDTTPEYPLTKLLWNHWSGLRDSRIKVYGWVNPGMNLSTSKQTNAPMSYDIVPNKAELDQAVLRIERQPDTVQTDHMDWGFRLSNVYGIDYRYTTSQGYFSQQLLGCNQLYGYDPVEAYAQLYFPKIAQGAVVTIGRYISPVDIEAQLAPQNYLYTHSIMFTFDAYTQTGVNTAVKLDDKWTVLVGVHGGDDIGVWNPASQFTGQALVRWVSDSNKDSLWGGIDSINKGYFSSNHDNLQENNLTWTHVFNKNFLTQTEAYYMYQYDAAMGGTCNLGPVREYGGGGGCGPVIPGMSSVWGAVNYTEWKFSDTDFLSVRNDWMDDRQGQRSGFKTNYASWTAGVTHSLTSLTEVRPEIRFDHTFSPGVTPFDNGTRRDQLTFNMDLIQWF